MEEIKLLHKKVFLGKIITSVLRVFLVFFIGANVASAAERKGIPPIDHYPSMENRDSYLMDICCMPCSQYSYSGCTKFGKPSEKGILDIKYSNGQHYIGESWNGLPCGIGSLYIPYKGGTRRLYNGEWKDGLFSGEGILTSSHEDSYVGDFQNGRPHGFGLRTYPFGVTSYRGWFVNGEREGEGILFHTVKAPFYVAKFAIVNGKWKECRFPTKRKYIEKGLFVGTWKNDRPTTTPKYSKILAPVVPSKLRNVLYESELDHSSMDIEDLCGDDDPFL
ncbi:MAG: hypothetical protein LBB21_03340 [Holosporaceae bacterium]|jgi:hypothetical protein|nr:hypothetical protein [Holosporaceae bacterium]